MSNSNERWLPSAPRNDQREGGPRAIGDILANSDFYSRIRQTSAQSGDQSSEQSNHSSLNISSSVSDMEAGTHENTPADSLPNSEKVDKLDTPPSIHPDIGTGTEANSLSRIEADSDAATGLNVKPGIQVSNETSTQSGMEPNMHPSGPVNTEPGSQASMRPSSQASRHTNIQMNMRADSLSDIEMPSEAHGKTSGQANSQSSSQIDRTPQMDTPTGQGVRTALKSKSGRSSGQTKKNPIAEAPIVYLGEFPQVRTQQQERLLKVFQAAPHCRTTLGGLSRKLQIPYGSVRRILARLRELELIRYEHVTEKGFQGLEVWYLGQDDLPTIMPIGEQTAGEPGGADRPSTPTGHPINIEEREKEKKQKTLSVWDISVENIEALWPHAHQAGLFPHHIRQVREAFLQQGRNDDGLEKLIAQTLRYLEWQLENGGISDRTGNRVDSPVQYWLKSMQRNGCYDKPKGYVDPHLLALKEVESQEEQLLATQKRIQDARDEQEKEARKKELQQILEELAVEGEKHSLWAQVYDSLPEYIRAQIGPGGSRMILEKGLLRHMVWIALKRIFCISEDTFPS